MTRRSTRRYVGGSENCLIEPANAEGRPGGLEQLHRAAAGEDRIQYPESESASRSLVRSALRWSVKKAPSLTAAPGTAPRRSQLSTPRCRAVCQSPNVGASAARLERYADMPYMVS